VEVRNGLVPLSFALEEWAVGYHNHKIAQR